MGLKNQAKLSMIYTVAKAVMTTSVWSPEMGKESRSLKRDKKAAFLSVIFGVCKSRDQKK